MVLSVLRVIPWWIYAALALFSGWSSLAIGDRLGAESARLELARAAPAPRHMLTESEGAPGTKSPMGEVLVTGVPVTSGRLGDGRQFVLLGPQSGEGVMVAMVFDAEDLPPFEALPRNLETGAVTVAGLVSANEELRRRVHGMLGTGAPPRNLYVATAYFDERHGVLAATYRAYLISFVVSTVLTVVLVVVAGAGFLTMLWRRQARVAADPVPKPEARPAPTHAAQDGPWGGRRQRPGHPAPAAASPPTKPQQAKPAPKAAPRPAPKPIATSGKPGDRFARSPIESRRKGFWGRFSG